MDIDMFLSNAHAKIFFLGQPILELWDFKFDKTPKMAQFRLNKQS